MSWKKVFKDKILAPVVIGTIIITIGAFFDIKELSWMGIGVALVGSYFLFRGRD